MPDKEKITSLVRAAQAGDDLAFAELVRAYQDIAVAYATAILRDYHLAEDVAQEAFVEAYRELPALREPAAFAAWFRTVIFKHCDRIRRRKRHPVVTLDAALEVASPEPSPHEALELQETKAFVWKAIAALSEAERAVVLLYYMGEHSQAVIAEFLNITANAVKTRLYAARKRLRKHMERIEEDLNAARPSSDSRFAEKVQRMIRPEPLKKNDRLYWSPGIGADVWEMFCAAITGDLETVKRLLDKDPSLARSQYEYRTPLSFAVRENHLEVAAYLLEHGATFSFGNMLEIARDRGYAEMQKLIEAALARPHDTAPKGAAIAAAIRERDLAKARSLLDADPALTHAPDELTNQPIHWAVMTRQIDMIDELLSRGADIDARRGDGARPIQLCNGDYNYRGWRDAPLDWPTAPHEVLTHLRARGAYVDICTAAHIGDLERVRELLDEDPSLANRPSDYVTYYACSGTPLRNAAAGGHIEIIKLLLEHGADPNLPEEHIAPRGHALHSAVCNGHIEIVKLLLEHGAYPNVEVESSADTLSAALGEAGYGAERNQQMVDLLCSYGAARPAHLLAHCNDLQTAAAVFAANPALADDPDALGSAARHEAFVRLMLRYQPDLPKRRSIGGGTREITELLFQHGMDPNKPNWLRITPLHHFAKSGDVENAAIFIERGADLNARDEEFCSTPLGWAARCGKARMAEFLLRCGAKPSLPDDPPWATPLQWATRRGHDQIVRLLTEYEKTGALPVHSLAEYETLASDLVKACDLGEDDAMRRVADHFQIGRRLSWDQPTQEARVERLRRFARERLSAHANSGNESGAIALADAQLLVARSLGFKSWEQLAKHVEEERYAE
ncbi:MAG TPA: sigma-70 family RNA polymerase sigma factor [Blastocatellia bacterium]|nr:sigma-70 family RNA polymerase sigma factor [Blastocatellia bacterium]